MLMGARPGKLFLTIARERQMSFGELFFLVSFF